MKTQIKKETILDGFHALTEIEIENAKDVVKANPKRNSDLGMIYVLAINRCRQILDGILKE